MPLPPGNVVRRQKMVVKFVDVDEVTVPPQVAPAKTTVKKFGGGPGTNCFGYLCRGETNYDNLVEDIGIEYDEHPDCDVNMADPDGTQRTFKKATNFIAG